MPSRLRAIPLRHLLAIDAVTCLAMGALLLLAAAPIARATALPPALLVWAGAALLPVGAFMAAVAWQAAPSRIAVQAIVAGNMLWVLASLAILIAGLVAPNLAGLVLVAGQAVVVAVLAKAELVASPAQPG